MPSLLDTQGFAIHPSGDQQPLGQQQQQQQQLQAASKLSDHPRAYGSRRSLQQLGPLAQYSPLLTPMDIVVEHGWDALGKLAVLGAASGGLGMSALSHAIATAQKSKATGHPLHSATRSGNSYSNGAPNSGAPPPAGPAPQQAQGQTSPGLAGQVAGAIPSAVRGVAGDRAEPVLGTLSQGAQLLAPVAGPAAAPVLGAFGGGAQQQQQQQQPQPQGLMLESGSLMDFSEGLAGLGGGDSAGDYLGPGSSDWLPAFQSALAGDDDQGYTETNPLTSIYSAFTGGDSTAQQGQGSGLLEGLLQLQQGGSSSSSSNPIVKAVQNALSSSIRNPSTAGGNPLLSALRSALGADDTSLDTTEGTQPAAAGASAASTAGSSDAMQGQRASISNMRLGQNSAYNGPTQATTYNAAYGSSGAPQSTAYNAGAHGSTYGGAGQGSTYSRGYSSSGTAQGTNYNAAAQGSTYSGASQGSTYGGASQGSTYGAAAQGAYTGSYSSTYGRVSPGNSGARQATANSGSYGSTYRGAYGSSYGSGSNMPLAATPAAAGSAPGQLLLEQGSVTPQQLQQLQQLPQQLQQVQQLLPQQQQQQLQQLQQLLPQQQQGRNGQTQQNPYGEPRNMVYGNSQQLAQSLKKYHTVPQWQHVAAQKALQGLDGQVPQDLRNIKKLVKPVAQTAKQTTHSIMYDSARSLVEAKRFDNQIKGQLVNSTANALIRAKPTLQGLINKTAIVEPWTDAARSIMKQKAQYVHDFANDMAENEIELGFDLDVVTGRAANVTRNSGLGILPNISKSLAQAVAGGASNFFNGTRNVGEAIPQAIQPLLTLTQNTLTNGVTALAPALSNAVGNTQRLANGLVKFPTEIGTDAGKLVSAGVGALPGAITTLARGVSGWGTPLIPWTSRGVDILSNAGVVGVGAVGKVMHDTVVPFTEGALKAVGTLGQSLLTDGFNAGTGEGLAATMQRHSPYQDQKLENARLENQPALMLPQSFAPLGAMMQVRYPCPPLKPPQITGPVPGQPAVPIPVPPPQIPGQPPVPGAIPVPAGPPTAPVGTIVGRGIPCGVDLFMVPKHAVPRQGIPRNQPIPDVEWTLEPQVCSYACAFLCQLLCAHAFTELG